MSDIRLNSLPFKYDGREYKLRCNMNVLADVQEAYGGDFSAALNGRGAMHSVLEFLAAMMNDYADEQGWFDEQVGPTGFPAAPILAKRFTARQLGRVLHQGQIPGAEIVRLVTASLSVKSEAQEPEAEADAEGN